MCLTNAIKSYSQPNIAGVYHFWFLSATEVAKQPPIWRRRWIIRMSSGSDTLDVVEAFPLAKAWRNCMAPATKSLSRHRSLALLRRLRQTGLRVPRTWCWGTCILQTCSVSRGFIHWNYRCTTLSHKLMFHLKHVVTQIG